MLPLTQGSQTQIFTRAALAGKNVPQAAAVKFIDKGFTGNTSFTKMT